MVETLHDRLEKLIADRRLSVAEAERLCGLGNGAIRKLLKNRDQMPNSRTLAALATGFGVTEQWLLHGTELQSPQEVVEVTPLPIETHRAGINPIANPFDLPRDIEVRGTAAGSHLRGAFQFEGDAIDFVRRPPALMGARDVYALYVEGSSMEPQFFPGDLIYVHPRRPAKIGDPVVVQSKVGADHVVEGTIGIYLRKTEKYIIIGKHNPAAQVQIPRDEGTVIHKIMTLNELFGV